MKRAFFFFFTLFWAGQIFAGSPATSGFQFLKMQVSARAAAMGGAFLAIPGDVSSLYYNPAGIANIKSKSASFTYQDDLLDFNSGFIGYVHPEFGPGNVGISVLYRDYGSFDRTDVSGQQMGTFGANSVAFVGSYGLSPKENLNVGGSVKYIRGAIDTYTADAVAADIGVMYSIPEQQLVFAAGLFNAGTSISAFISEKHDLPMQMRAGFSKVLAHLPLLIGLNFYKYNDEPWYFALGGEFTITPSLFLRLGYDSYGRDLAVDSSKDTLAGAALGLGFLWQNISFDYAYSSLGALGSLNRFTISGHF
jgi:long-subunit fatty acid transport protein